MVMLASAGPERARLAALALLSASLATVGQALLP